MKLSTDARNDLPAKDFAVSGRRFPIEDKNHARAALSMVNRAKDLTEDQKREVIRKASAMLNRN